MKLLEYWFNDILPFIWVCGIIFWVAWKWAVKKGAEDETYQ